MECWGRLSACGRQQIQMNIIVLSQLERCRFKSPTAQAFQQWVGFLSRYQSQCDLQLTLGTISTFYDEAVIDLVCLEWRIAVQFEGQNRTKVASSRDG